VVILEESKGRPAAVVDVVTGDLHLSPHAYGVLQAVPPKDPVAWARMPILPRRV